MKRENAGNESGIEFVTLDAGERKRVAAWLSGIERIYSINTGRWVQICDGNTDYLSVNELAELMDHAPPFGFALDIIRGECRMRELTDENELMSHPDEPYFLEWVKCSMMEHDINKRVVPDQYKLCDGQPFRLEQIINFNFDHEQKLSDDLDERMSETPCTCESWRDIDGRHHDDGCAKMRLLFVYLGVGVL